MRKKRIRTGFGLGVVGLIFSMFCIGNNEKTTLNDIKLKQEAYEVSESNYVSDPNLFTEEETPDVAFYMPSVTKTENSTALKITLKEDDASTNNYMFGYFGSDSEYYPCAIQCTFKNKFDTTFRIGTAPLNYDSTLVKYIGVGNRLGPKEQELTCDIEHGFDEEVDFTKPVYLINVFKYQSVDGDETNRKPNFNERYKLEGYLGTNAENNSSKTYDISDYCEFNFEGVSTFNGFSSFKVSVDSSKSVESYKNDKTYGKMYSKYEEDIESGTMYVRTRFSFGGDTRYVVELKNGEKVTLSDLATNVEIKNNRTDLYFLLKGINYQDVKNLTVKGGLIYVGIYNTKTYKEVSKSGFSMRYGYLNFKIDDILYQDGSVGIAKESKYYTFNCDLLVIISISVFVLLYLVISLTTYFILKKKYENDEFRKMNTKLYFKNNILGLLCIGSVILFTEFTVIRFGILSNSLPVFNPSDVWVIIFAVASLLLVGYFIRYFYLLIKAKRERIRNEKLKLRLDKQDDGTIAVNK